MNPAIKRGKVQLARPMELPSILIFCHTYSSERLRPRPVVLASLSGERDQSLQF